jgi:SAM-dependent methyltransferase
MISPVKLICNKHNLPLQSVNNALTCEKDCCYPVVDQIPRFVAVENYSSSFGLQWNIFRSTQLDSFTGLTISKDRLIRIAGGSLEIFREKTVLEAGCGAGRFTELLLEAGALLFATDLSSAVEANYKNCSSHANYFVCQADLRELPVLPEQFDIVICIGVIQHTPSPEETMKILTSQVKPGGLLLIDHYSPGYPMTPSRKRFRTFLLNQPGLKAMRQVERVVKLLWPIHKMLYKYRNTKGIAQLRSKFLYWSPVVDYYDSYAQLGEKLMYEWALLDTHDALTDFYKHLRTKEEIESHLISLGLEEVYTVYAGNGVEAQARKPER